MKVDRKAVYDKCTGHCAYCGNPIEIKDMQIDHVMPVKRQMKFVKKTNERGFTHTVPVFSGKYDYPERLHIDNCLPSCRFCNNYKHSFSLEDFRNELSKQLERCKLTSANYRMAVRYGLVQETPKPIVFYFEAHQATNSPKN
jgi:5-methylcytosine-specific restriction endonuclease McrA